MKLLCMNGHLSDSNDQMKSDFGFDYYRLDNNKSSRTLFMKVSINGCKKGGTSKSNNQKIKITLYQFLLYDGTGLQSIFIAFSSLLFVFFTLFLLILLILYW